MVNDLRLLGGIVQYYQRDLAFIHDRGYGLHADRCAPGILEKRHENVLVDTSRIPALLAGHGVRATVGTSFGDAELPAGLRLVTGSKG